MTTTDVGFNWRFVALVQEVQEKVADLVAAMYKLDAEFDADRNNGLLQAHASDLLELTDFLASIPHNDFHIPLGADLPEVEMLLANHLAEVGAQ